jgi:hypothetical protein
MLKRNKAGQYLVYTLICLVFAGCGINESNKRDGNTGISGRFVNQTFLQQVPDSIAGTIQGYCYELNFISPDSVMINYGFEEGTLAYKQEGDHYRLIGSIPFTLNTDGSITLSDSAWLKRGDTAWTGAPLNSKFIKVPDVKGQKWVFDQYLNERMIAGTYQLFKGEKQASQQIIFNKDGSVSGLENYISYSICYSGDCTGETELASDQVTFKTRTGAAITYAIKLDKNRTINFYTIGPMLKDNDGNDLKGGRAIEGKVFELRKQ